MKTPPGHLAIKVDECAVAAEAVVRHILPSRPTPSAQRRPWSPGRLQMRSRMRGNLRLAARGRPLPTTPAHA
eukprot:9235249-Pyramimonas_sp.AAC.1